MTFQRIRFNSIPILENIYNYQKQIPKVYQNHIQTHKNNIFSTEFGILEKKLCHKSTKKTVELTRKTTKQPSEHPRKKNTCHNRHNSKIHPKQLPEVTIATRASGALKSDCDGEKPKDAMVWGEAATIKKPLSVKEPYRYYHITNSHLQGRFGERPEPVVFSGALPV